MSFRVERWGVVRYKMVNPQSDIKNIPFLIQILVKKCLFFLLFLDSSYENFQLEIVIIDDTVVYECR